MNSARKTLPEVSNPDQVGMSTRHARRSYEARERLNELKGLSRKSYVSPYYTALIYAGLGEKDRALEWIEGMYQEREESLSGLKVDPPFDSLHSDPRFIDLLHRVNLAP